MRRSASPACCDGRSSSSCSTERSQSVTWSSAPEAAKHESSVGCHSIDVMGAVCHEKAATGVGAGALVLEETRPSQHPGAVAKSRTGKTNPLKFRRSQTLIAPSSPPEASR